MSRNQRIEGSGGRGGLKRRTSIRTKIILVVVMVSFITASLITAMQVRTVCRNILHQTQTLSKALSIPVKYQVDAILNRESGPRNFGYLAQGGVNMELQKMLGEVLAWADRPELVTAYLVDEKGQVVAEAGKTRTSREVSAEVFESKVKGIRKTVMVRNGERYDTFAPYYTSQGRVAGYIVIGASAQSLWDRAAELTAGTIISFAIVSVITIAVLGLWVSRYMIKPLRTLTESIVHAAQDGKIELGKLTKSADEIGQLAQVTDEVLSELHRRQKELSRTSELLSAENTRLERTQRALMDMERHYRSAVEAATGVAYELDLATGKFAFLSRQVYDAVGYATEDLPSSDVWTGHIHEDDRAEAEQALTACLEGKKSCFSRNYRFVCKDGHELQMIELGGVIFDKAGRPARVSGIIMPAHMLPKSLLATS